MHCLISILGSTGDIHPLLGMAATLHDRGHRVTVCTNAVFRADIEALGLAFLENGDAEEYRRLVNHPDLWNPIRLLSVAMEWLRLRLRREYDLLRAHIDDDTVLVVSQLTAFSARILQEQLGTPVVLTMLSASAIPALFEPRERATDPIRLARTQPLRMAVVRLLERTYIDRKLAPILNSLRRELGLPPVRHVMTRWMYSNSQCLGLLPDWFVPPRPHWPTPLAFSGFQLYENRADDDPTLEAFLDAGPPPVVVATASTVLHAAAFYRSAAETLTRIGRRGVFLDKTGSQIPADLPPTILHRPHALLSRLLPRSAALVHNGGMGMMALALAAGTPQVVVPIGNDQPKNALHLARLGCGVRLSSKPAALNAGLPQALREVLEHPGIRARCLEYRARMASADTARGRAADVIERVAATQLPPVPRVFSATS